MEQFRPYHLWRRGSLGELQLLTLVNYDHVFKSSVILKEATSQKIFMGNYVFLKDGDYFS